MDQRGAGLCVQLTSALPGMAAVSRATLLFTGQAERGCEEGGSVGAREG